MDFEELIVNRHQNALLPQFLSPDHCNTNLLCYQFHSTHTCWGSPDHTHMRWGSPGHAHMRWGSPGHAHMRWGSLDHAHMRWGIPGHTYIHWGSLGHAHMLLTFSISFEVLSRP